MINHREYFPLVRGRLLQQWQLLWQQEERGRHAFSIFPTVGTRPWFKRLNMSRQEIVFVNRAATNHNRSDAHLARFGIVDANHCACGEDYATIDHMMWRCPTYDRTPLRQSLDSQTMGCSIRDLIALKRWEELRIIASFCREERIPF